MDKRKGLTGSVLVIITSAIALIVGLWMISATVSNLPMPVVPYSVTNESITLTNLTYTNFGAQANCLNDYPQNQLCGIQQGGVTSVVDSTGMLGLGNVTYDNNGLSTMRINTTFVCQSPTIIILNGSNGGNVGDTEVDWNINNRNYGASTDLYIVSDPVDSRRIFILWNLSAIPAGATITNANMSFHVKTQPSFQRYYVAYNTSLYNSTGDGPWVEGTLSPGGDAGAMNALTQNMTWNNQPFCTTSGCNPPTGDFIQDNITNKTAGSRMYWDITNAAITSHANATNQNMSIMIRDSNEGVGANFTVFYSKERSTASQRPQLEITYTTSPDKNTCHAGTWLVSYTYNDYPSTTPYNAFSSAITNTFNAFALLAVGLIVMAAVVIISYFQSNGGQK